MQAWRKVKRMKIKTLIKADFYCNPEKYGFDETQPFSLDEVWKKVIKVNIIEFDSTPRIKLNSLAAGYIEGCREFFKDYLEEWYSITKADFNN